jgi:hypothetical protein
MNLKILLLILLISSCATQFTHNSIISLNGNDENHSVNDKQLILSDASKFSFSVWIKPDVLNKNQEVIAISTGNVKVPIASRGSLRITDTGQIHVFARSTDNPDYIQVANTKVSNSLRLNEWNHIVVNFDIEKKDISIYVNNFKMELIEDSFNFKNNKLPASPSHSFIIGSEDDSSNNFFNGSIKNIEIKRITLSEDKITQIFLQQSSRLDQ